MPSAADFARITLNGAGQTTTSILDSFVVSDSGDTGAGWHVMAQVERFISKTGRTLAPNSLKMSAPKVSGPGILPVVVAGPYALDLGEPFQIASAQPGTGVGIYTFSATTLTLGIPTSAYAGTYTGAITISVLSAP